MKFLIDFKKFSVNESEDEEAGYGNDYFVDKKNGKNYNYYFKINESGDGEERGIVFKVGKFSKSELINDAEKSYGVISIEEMAPNDMDDYLVNDVEYESDTEKTFSLGEEEMNETFDILGKVLDNYLSKNPKVTKIYDEILENLEMDLEEYSKYVDSFLNRWSKGRWKSQEGSTAKTIIYTKTAHE